MNNSASFAPFFTLGYGNESLARHNLFGDVFVGFCPGLAELEVLDVSQLLFLSVLGRFFSCSRVSDHVGFRKPAGGPQSVIVVSMVVRATIPPELFGTGS